MPFSGHDGPALSFHGVSIRYGSAVALEDVSFDVAPGSLTGIIGPNGAGKSTLVKALCGRTPLSSGSVTIAGSMLKAGQQRHHLLGLVPQSIGLYPHLTGRENLEIFARFSGLDGKLRRERVEAALETVQMTSRADRRVDRMSGGMQRRINVAAAILHQPPTIVFDEPTAGVDIPARDVIHLLARDLADAGHAVLLVTHELEQAELICDHVLILERGRKVAFECPSSLLSRRFGDVREVVLRFRSAPDAEVRAAIAPFGFQKSDMATEWTAVTDASQVSFVSAFMASLKNRDDVVREVSVRRPGLAHVIRQLEAA